MLFMAIFFSRGNNENYLGLQVNCWMLLSDFNKFGAYRQIFAKVCNIKFYENPSSGSHANRGQTDGRILR